MSVVKMNSGVGSGSGSGFMDKLRMYHGLNSGLLCIYKHANLERIANILSYSLVNYVCFGVMYSAIQDLYMMYYDDIPECIRLFKSNRKLILPASSKDLKLKHIMNYGSIGGLVFGAYFSLMSMSIFRVSVKGKTVHII